MHSEKPNFISLITSAKNEGKSVSGFKQSIKRIEKRSELQSMNNREDKLTVSYQDSPRRTYSVQIIAERSQQIILYCITFLFYRNSQNGTGLFVSCQIKTFLYNTVVCLNCLQLKFTVTKECILHMEDSLSIWII